MTVQAAVQMWSRHDATLRSKDGSQYTAVVKEAYQVVTDPTDEISDVVSATDLPQLGDTYKSAPQIRVVNIRPKQESPVFWTVEVEYKGQFSQKAYSQTGTVAGNPLDKPPVFRWGKTEREVTITEDRNGKAIATVLEEPYPPQTVTINDITCVVTRNYAGVDLAATHRYLHSVNSDNFLGFSPGTARLTSFDAAHQWNETVGGYWEVNAEITFRYPWKTTAKKAWYLRLPHQGFLELRKTEVTDALPGEEVPAGLLLEAPMRAVDDGGQDVVQPVLLDEEGRRLPKDDDPHFLEFEIFEPLSYKALGLL